MKVEIFAGIPCYSDQPAGTRLAMPSDFFLNGIPRAGMFFLVHSFHSNQYEAYKVKADFKIDLIRPWLKENRVYVKSNLTAV